MIGKVEMYNGMKGNSFDTPQLGIRAQVQHLKAYASMEPLVNAVVDPRFKCVARGSALLFPPKDCKEKWDSGVHGESGSEYVYVRTA